MGQSASVPGDELTHGDFVVQKLLKDEIIGMFHKDCKKMLRSVEAKAITSKINTTTLAEKNILTPSDLAFLFQLSSNKDVDITTISGKFSDCIRYIYDCCKVVSSFPFLRDFECADGNLLTLDDLLVSSVFHTKRYKSLVGPNFNYRQLMFLMLCHKNIPIGPEVPLLPKTINDEKSHSKDTAKVKIMKENGELTNQVLWKLLDVIKNLDYIPISDLVVSAKDLLQVMTLFLVILSVTKSTRAKMQDSLNVSLKERWGDFEDVAISILKYYDISITLANVNQKYLTFEQVFDNQFQLIGNLLEEGFEKIFKDGLLSSNYEDTVEPLPEDLEIKKKSSVKFEESKLVTRPTITAINGILKNINSSVEVTSENLIKLYIGREAGFSIRSLELKIFKWQAPTLFVVSGKRLKSKTAISNRRYIQFDSSFPRFFRSLENTLKSWQGDNDRITYAVLVNKPWQLSNKKNFGDTECLILSLLPHVDFYKSTNNPVLGSDSIYFNTLGLGIGFGNEQPINKNEVKKYLPGDVSLTIESNLEFAVFRHVLSSKGNTYFNKSTQSDIKGTDFEDRFIITDLEVWGVGSTKELEQQKKQWEWEQKMAEARQSVNLQTMGEDRAFLEMVGLVGNHGGSGGSV